MKKSLLILAAILYTLFLTQANAQEIYSKAYGEKTNPALLFMHGGPGYNSVSFELSTAQKLADEGYFVIVYDQRGGGRSKDILGSKYTFEEAFADINTILNQYGVKKISLLGHSWGGTLGLQYAMKHPEKINKFIMVDSPLSYQKSFKTIIKRCKEKYTSENSPNLQYILMLEKMDTTTIEYSSYCFMNAMQCGLYSPKNQSAESQKLYKELSKLPEAKYMSDMTREPVSGFFTNEKYTLMDMTEEIKKLAAKNKIFGIFGADDGLFDEAQFDEFKSLMGEDNFSIVQDASHSVFIDQREQFIDLVEWYMSGE